MFGSIIPREGKFFDLFKDLAVQIVEAAIEFRKMAEDPDHYESHYRIIKDHEHKADNITHQTIDLLHKTFITPMDRDDIKTLVSELDDILDLIDAAASRVFLYNTGPLTKEAIELAEVCLQSVLKVQVAVGLLDNLKHPEEILRICVEVHRLENEADHILRNAVAKLFAEEQDTRRLIKFKEVYELLEKVTDCCEDVANTIDGIVVEYS